METNKAISEAYRLYEKWVGPISEQHGKGYDLNRIQVSMLREARWHRTGKSSATVGLIREVKGELILLGKIRKALSK